MLQSLEIKKTVVALSSTEAEYVALCAAAQETVWLRHLLASIRFKQKDATVEESEESLAKEAH